MASAHVCPKISCSKSDWLSPKELRRLRRSRSIDEFKTTRSLPLQQLIHEAVRAVQKSYRRVPASLRVHVEPLLLNLYAAWGRAAPAIRYSLHRDDYNSRLLRRHHKLSYRVLHEHVIPCLVEAGYIRARCGYVEPAQKLIESFERIGWHHFDIEHSPDFPDVRLRRRKRRIRGADGRYKQSEDGRFVKFAPLMLREEVPQLEAQIVQYTDDMQTINPLIERTFVYPFVPDAVLRTWKRKPDSTRKRLYRVFNNVSLKSQRLDQGGRLFGHWAQSLNEDQRRHLCIANEPACEIDFSTMEPTLAYAEAGEQIELREDYDAYMPLSSPKTKRRRKRYKTLLLIMLNSDSRERALCAALRPKRDPSRDLSHLEEDEIRRRMKLLEDMHLPHIPIYGKKAGMKRMNRESNIAVGIVKKLVAGGIPCIPIHDSFLVPASRAKHAEQIICSEFHAQTGFRIKVKIQPTLIRSGLTPKTADRQEYSEFFRQRALHEQKYGPIA